MEGFDAPGDGPQATKSEIDYRPPSRIITPLGMGVEKRERADLEGNPTEVRLSFVVGVPPGIVTEEIVIRMEDAQAYELATLLTGGIHLARADEVPT